MSRSNLSLKDLCIFVNGGAWNESEYAVQGIPVFKVSNIKGAEIDLSNVDYLPISSAEKYQRHFLKENDLIIATVGSHQGLANSAAGRGLTVNRKIAGYLLNQNAVCIRTARPDILHQKYVGYIGKSEHFKHFIQTRGRGAANQMRIAVGEIKEYVPHLPSLDVQSKIVSVLSAYDELIDNNRSRINLLNEMAAALYELCFVRKQMPNDAGEKAAIESGPWQEVKLSSLITKLESGSRPKGGIDKSLKTGIASIGAENVIGAGSYKYGNERLISTDFFNCMKKGKVEQKDILIYKDGAYIGKTSMFQDDFPHKICAVNEHVFLINSKNRFMQNYLYYTLSREEYYEKMQALNSNSAQPGLNRDKLGALDVIKPPDDLIARFNDFVEPMVKLIFNLAKQNRLIEEAQSLLMPRLMTGNVDIDEYIEGAGARIAAE
ncbi:restriction endonuclease subunit S [Rhizobium mesoamericanum]|nr:restriction endonuclease subunit S [Rhizobium mesoamericanum]